MNYEEALAFIHGSHKFGLKHGLENIKTLLSFMGNPQDKLKFVHVAGTNGKGSTAVFIQNILVASGLSTGLYTSPFLLRFNERYRVNHLDISDHHLTQITQFVQEKVLLMRAQSKPHPTEFEIVTAIGFQYFYEMNCQLVVLEVGLGGRFDATNVIHASEVSVISAIGYDHMNILGNELSQIAFEKAGIIKANSSLVLSPQKYPAATTVITEICQKNQATLAAVDEKSLVLKSFDTRGQSFDYKDLPDLRIKLLGAHQLLNAATALEAIKILQKKGYPIEVSHIKEGLLKTSWPGRCEILSQEPLLIIDGAHNVDGAKALVQTLQSFFREYTPVLILGLLKDKEVAAILAALLKCTKNIVTVKPQCDRALSSQDLADIILEQGENLQVISASSYADAILEAKIMAANLENPLILACGSLYYIGEIRNLVLNEEA